jgi:hypothetical protein
MAKLTFRTDLPPNVNVSLEELYTLLGTPQVKRKLRADVLTAEELRKLGDEPLRKKMILQVVANCRDFTLERALLDLMWDADLIAAGRYKSLRRSIGEPISREADPRPEWDSKAGKVALRGKVIRTVAVRAKNVRAILKAFEDARWPPHVEFRFRGIKAKRRLHETVRTLNEGLRGIKFFCDGSTTGVQWQKLP